MCRAHWWENPATGAPAQKWDNSRDPCGKTPTCLPCYPKAGVTDVGTCLRSAFSSYAQPSQYKLSGPNSNTFAGTLARACCGDGSEARRPRHVPGLGRPAGAVPCRCQPVSTGATDMLTQYLTFVSRRRHWRLYRGVGTKELLAERVGTEPVVDAAASVRPFLWLVCAGPGRYGPTPSTPSARGGDDSVDGGRIGAVTTAPDGERAVVLELPDDVGGEPRLRLWTSADWQPIETRERPDISSALAWIGRDALAYESATRRVAVIDLASSQTELGPPGSSPAAAVERREWHAVSAGKVLTFPVDRPFDAAPRLLEGFSFGTPFRIRFTNDGEVCTWLEPFFVKQVKGYVQQRGGRRRRLRELNDGFAIVVGPVEGMAA